MSDTTNVETVESTDTNTEVQKVNSDEAQNGAETPNQQGKDNQAKLLTPDEVSAIVAREVKKAKGAERLAIEQERKDAELPEIEKAKKDVGVRDETIKTLTQRLHTQAIQMAAIREAKRLGVDFVESDDSNGLDDAMKLGLFDECEVGDDGKALGVADVLKKIQKSRPHLLKQNSRREAPDLDAAARGGSNALGDENYMASVAQRMGIKVPTR